MAQAPIRVTILDDTSGDRCPNQCGMLSPMEDFQFVIEHLKEKYAEAIEVDYLDLANLTSGHPKAELADRIRAQNLALPIVAINGLLKLSGSVQYRAIVEAIETEREVVRAANL